MEKVVILSKDEYEKILKLLKEGFIDKRCPEGICRIIYNILIEDLDRDYD